MRMNRASVADRLQSAALGLLLVGVMSIPAYLALQTWIGQQQLKAAWTITGPPCPEVAQPSPLVVGRKPPKTFSYGGIAFTRQFGHASCVAIPEPGLLAKTSYRRVCQFSGPAMVAVRTPDGREVIYQPGVAQRTTVTVRDGRPSCVVAGWFRY